MEDLPAAEAKLLEGLQERLGIRFRNPRLLREAMTHASWTNERGEPTGPGHDNERLEYLGDAVLELVVGEYLFRRFPGYDEGQLTQLRAALVNTASLARLAERVGVGDTLLLGRGAAKTGGRRLPSLLANAFEALIGAIFLDQGFRVAARVFLQNIGDLAEWTDDNFKGRLQEVAQNRLGETPRYRVVAAGGPGHHREYTAEVLVGDRAVAGGRGSTKQAAEQAAARIALDQLEAGRLAGRNVAEAAAGAAREAARSASDEPARVRRRVAELAADRGATSLTRRRRAPSQPSPAAATETGTSHRRRGLLAALRSAAELLVGKQPEPPPAPEPAKKRRRGRRGGRGRGGTARPRREGSP